MRAPRVVREFFEWRWATCIALIAGALAFVVLALLLIPAQLEPVRVDSQRHAAIDETVPERAHVESAPVLAPQPSPVVPVPVVAAPEPALTADNAVAAPAAPVSPPDFKQNIVDRADRPTRPRERLQ